MVDHRIQHRLRHQTGATIVQMHNPFRARGLGAEFINVHGGLPIPACCQCQFNTLELDDGKRLGAGTTAPERFAKWRTPDIITGLASGAGKQVDS
jgi:hypothetical protein